MSQYESIETIESTIPTTPATNVNAFHTMNSSFQRAEETTTTGSFRRMGGFSNSMESGTFKRLELFNEPDKEPETKPEPVKQ